jgi:dihydrofolate synthase/folylpolyglutamate synthase
MEYDAALRWLLMLPDFERTGDFASRPDVAPMLALLWELGDPHRGRPTIHIAGSKGKGSTGAMIEGVLGAASMRTGYYISPHLHRFNERIRIDGQAVERGVFAAAMTRVRDAIDAVAPRFPGRQFLAFDALTAAGFVAFRDAGVDVQVVEVGLGGLLDSTNVFGRSSVAGRRSSVGSQSSADGGQGSGTSEHPHVVVLTPISLEHTAILGDTIAAIAGQKAGIIIEGATVVVAPQRESALDVFRAIALDRGATVIEVALACQMVRTTATAEGQRFKLKTARATYDAQLPLAGRHQLDNAATAIVASEALAERCGVELTPVHVSAGIAKVVWPGRLEVLKRKPLVIVDGAHNGDSAKRMVVALREYFGLSHATLLFGTLTGKDVASMAGAVAPIADDVFVTAWPSARAADPRHLAAAFAPLDVPVTTFGSLAHAYEAAVAQAGDRGAVVAFGAIAFVAAVREYVLGIESDAVRLASSVPKDAVDDRG